MQEKKVDRKIWIILASLALMLGIMALPTPAGLSTAGHRVLAILLFAVIMWMTESMPYAESAVALILFMLLALGFSPVEGTTGKLLGTGRAIPLAMSGFSNSGWVFVAAGIFMAAAITTTGFETRVAYMILRASGTSVNNIIAGLIVTGFVLTFIIPSVIARAATMVPIVLGLNKAFGLPVTSEISKVLLMTAGILPSLTGVGVLSGSAPNPVVANYIVQAGLPPVMWMDWFMYNFPFSVLIGVLLYFVMTRMHKFEYKELPGGSDYLNKCISDLGPMSATEKRVAFIMVCTILLWATDKFHGIDPTVVSIMSVFVMVCPYIGVTTLKPLFQKVDWTAILMFGAGISLGVVLMRTGAVQWLAKVSLVAAGVDKLPLIPMAYVIFVLSFTIRLAFTSITSCITALAPALLGFLVGMKDPSVPIIGIIMGMCVMAHDIFLTPVNSANTMIAYGTDAFKPKDMFRIGLPLTIMIFILMLPLMMFYWPLVGLMPK